MYTLLSSVDFKKLAVTQIPSFGGAFLVAEFIYKFGSFALECLAFVVTWFVLDWAFQPVVRVVLQSTGNSDSQ